MASQVFEFVCQGCREPSATRHAGMSFCDECYDARLRCDWCDALVLADRAISIEAGVSICADCDDKFNWSRDQRAQRARDNSECQRDAEAKERLVGVAS